MRAKLDLVGSFLVFLLEEKNDLRYLQPVFPGIAECSTWSDCPQKLGF